MILASAVLSQYTRVTDRQPTDRQTDNILWQQRKLQRNCNVQLKIEVKAIKTIYKLIIFMAR